ncbi:hypothetical protein AVEN_43845-1 [Araneus ventricosus]|uniref:Uncharacterized protein n=1 Tax=Araneus ventricosus TaxID=182803 RepID=A0A4Y2SQ27_ARAVE|nr:hypothetical protein AVEN_43845-1 [Araneus ventricosus]
MARDLVQRKSGHCKLYSTGGNNTRSNFLTIAILPRFRARKSKKTTVSKLNNWNEGPNDPEKEKESAKTSRAPVYAQLLTSVAGRIQKLLLLTSPLFLYTLRCVEGGQREREIERENAELAGIYLAAKKKDRGWKE